MSHSTSRTTRLFMVALALALLAGCAAPAPQPTPLPPTDTQAPPTETALPPTETATNTPLPPTETFTAVPTTAAPTATETPVPTETATPTMTATLLPLWTPTSAAAVGKTINIYYIQLDTGGTVGCGDSVVPVSTGVIRSNDISEDVSTALDILLRDHRKYIGNLYNPVSISNITLESVRFNDRNGLITVNMNGTYIPTGDDCDNTRVKAQIWSTIRQYRDIKMTNIYLNGGPFGDKVSNDK